MDEDYEVPSPHEHAFEEAAEKERNSLAQKIALMTAVLATVGALISKAAVPRLKRCSSKIKAF